MDVAASSSASLQCLVSSGLMSRLLSELDSDDDILTQLNCLELLTVLMSVRHGRQFLQTSGTLERLEDKLVNTSSDPLTELLQPGITDLSSDPLTELLQSGTTDLYGSQFSVSHRIFSCDTEFAHFCGISMFLQNFVELGIGQ